jgi:hypothetical protein
MNAKQPSSPLTKIRIRDAASTSSSACTRITITRHIPHANISGGGRSGAKTRMSTVRSANGAKVTSDQ